MTTPNEDAIEESINKMVLGEGKADAPQTVSESAAPEEVHPEDANPLLKITDLEVTFTTSTGIVPAVRGAT